MIKTDNIKETDEGFEITNIFISQSKFDGGSDFYPEDALMLLLADEQTFINSSWWEKEWPEDAKNNISVFANCSDIFAWGVADAERVSYGDLENLYEHWKKDQTWGVAIWCIKKRNEMPQKPVYDVIKSQGIWNIDEMNLNNKLN